MQFFDTSCQLATEQEKTQKLKNQEGNWYSNNSSSQKQQLSDLLGGEGSSAKAARAGEQLYQLTRMKRALLSI